MAACGADFCGQLRWTTAIAVCGIHIDNCDAFSNLERTRIYCRYGGFEHDFRTMAGVMTHEGSDMRYESYLDVFAFTLAPLTVSWKIITFIVSPILALVVWDPGTTPVVTPATAWS